MDGKLQEQLRILKLGYLKKLEGMLLELKVLSERTSLSIIDELYSKVHTVSGTSGMYGLNELSDVSNNFELYLKEIKKDNEILIASELKEHLTKFINSIEQTVEKG